MTLIIMVESEYNNKYRDNRIDLNCMLEIDLKYTLYGGQKVKKIEEVKLIPSLALECAW